LLRETAATPSFFFPSSSVLCCCLFSCAAAAARCCPQPPPPGLGPELAAATAVCGVLRREERRLGGAWDSANFFLLFLYVRWRKKERKEREMSIVNKGRTLDWESYFLSILFLFLRLFYLSKIDPLRERSRLFFLVFFV